MIMVNDSLDDSFPWCCRFIATLKQRYTQSNGRRPFGTSCLIAGFDMDGTPHLYLTDPSGTYTEWQVGSLMVFCFVF